MPRTQTAADERTEQNRRLQRESAAAVGADYLTLEAAKKVRRDRTSVVGIVQREILLDDEELQPIGVVLAKVMDYKVTASNHASLSLITNAVEFGDTIHDAARISNSEQLVVCLFRIPRPDIEDDDDE